MRHAHLAASNTNNKTNKLTNKFCRFGSRGSLAEVQYIVWVGILELVGAVQDARHGCWVAVVHARGAVLPADGVVGVEELSDLSSVLSDAMIMGLMESGRPRLPRPSEWCSVVASLRRARVLQERWASVLQEGFWLCTSARKRTPQKVRAPQKYEPTPKCSTASPVSPLTRSSARRPPGEASEARRGPLRTPNIKNLGKDSAPEELKTCPWVVGTRKFSGFSGAMTPKSLKKSRCARQDDQRHLHRYRDFAPRFRCHENVKTPPK